MNDRYGEDSGDSYSYCGMNCSKCPVYIVLSIFDSRNFDRLYSLTWRLKMSNKRNLVLFIAASLDGYIATEDDSLDWLFKIDGEGDNGYSEFYDTIDTILMGKRTYDWIVEKVEGDFPYKNKQCYVFSTSESGKNENVEFVNQDILEFTNAIKNLDGGNIWLVGGGNLIHSFVKARVIDEMIITIAPTLLGRGIPLFKRNDFEMELTLKSMRRFNQFVELRYEVKKQ